jgi:hypothetical protein
MRKKLSVGLAPLLIIAAFVVIPAAAEAATPHYFLNGTNPGARLEEKERVPTIAWGTLSLTNVKGGSGGTVSCHNVIGAYVENPGEGAGGPAGIGDTQSFNPYECESPQCTAAATGGGPATYISVLAEPNLAKGGDLTDLQWTNKLLLEGETIRQETEGAHVNVICHVQIGVEEFFNVEEKSEGNNRPKAGPTRFKAVAPPELIFDQPGSGNLHGPAPEEEREGKTEGVLKVLGYDEQGIVQAHQG